MFTKLISHVDGPWPNSLENPKLILSLPIKETVILHQIGCQYETLRGKERETQFSLALIRGGLFRIDSNHGARYASAFNYVFYENYNVLRSYALCLTQWCLLQLCFTGNWSLLSFLSHTRLLKTNIRSMLPMKRSTYASQKSSNNNEKQNKTLSEQEEASKSRPKIETLWILRS